MSKILKNFAAGAALFLLFCGFHWGSGYNEGSVPANSVSVDTSHFGTNLGSGDTDVQHALDTIDDLIFSGSGETNTASNLGGGLANYSTKVGVDLRFNSFNSSDFDLASNLISLDYTNGQKATGSVPGFLTAADWTTFNNKQAALTTGTLSATAPAAVSGSRTVIGGAAVISINNDGIGPTQIDETANYAWTGTTTFKDSTTTVVDDGDATKKIAFQASGITTGTTRTFTAPDENGTLCTTGSVCSGYQASLTTGTLSATAPAAVSGSRTVIGGAAVISINADGIGPTQIDETANYAWTGTTTFKDSTTTVVDDGDATKKIAFQASGITTGTTRTFTAPDENGTLCTTGSVCSGYQASLTTGTLSATSPVTVSGSRTVIGGAAVIAISADGIGPTQIDETATYAWTGTTTFKDSTTTIVDDGDATKKIAFQASGITTGTTRTITVPDSSGTLVYQARSISTTSPLSGGGDLSADRTLSITADGIGPTQIDETATYAWTGTTTFKDSVTTIVDDGDATKKIAFQASGITTATTRTITAPDSNTTIPIISQIVTISGPTAARTYTFPDAATTIVGTTDTQTLTNKRVTRRDTTTTQSATPTINTDNTDHSHITGLAQAITSFTTNLSGTPVAGDTLWIDITDNGTARAITWGTSFEASTVALPTTTVVNARLDVGFVWNEATSKWRCVAVA